MIIGFIVASYMDAWIEIIDVMYVKGGLTVASYMDAWIEISSNNPITATCASHPIWMRGLKLQILH